MRSTRLAQAIEAPPTKVCTSHRCRYSCRNEDRHPVPIINIPLLHRLVLSLPPLLNCRFLLLRSALPLLLLTASLNDPGIRSICFRQLCKSAYSCRHLMIRGKLMRSTVEEPANRLSLIDRLQMMMSSLAVSSLSPLAWPDHRFPVFNCAETVKNPS